ncbi:MAG TPA: trypsin-like peptidase domain-containing protein [Gaiellaceae bacterium]|jgi:S1-C subfamily serine protease|nr:trypsin-like peptidase domain-containing protein [Gaiellaceae bacterium]
MDAPRRIRLVPLAAAIVVAAVLIGLVGCGGGRRSAADTAVGAATTTGVASAPALQQQFVRIVRATSPSVVQIESATGLGSGVVYDRSGHIVTNAHVVGSDESLRVTLHDGRSAEATLVGRYVPDDLAVVHIGLSGLRPLPLEASSAVRVGDIVLAIGNPLGLRSSVTEGIVSAVGRTVSEPNGAVLPNVVQTSAPINPGNSGGALVDLEGKLVGVPTLGVEGGNGIGFAIATDRVRLVADQLIEHGRVLDTGRAYLGIRLAALADERGALVADVVAGGPAAAAGIRPGDVVTALAGRATPTAADLLSALAAKHPGDPVAVRLTRDGTTREVTVTLGELPASQG